MARLSTSLMLFCLLGIALAVPGEPDDQEQYRDDICNNACLERSNFPDPSCLNDPDCVCKDNTHIEAAFCCMIERCAPSVFPRALQRSSLHCESKNLEFSFDARVCGSKPTSTYAAPVPTNTAEAADNCNYDCFDSGFPQGYCTTDPACVCTQKKYHALGLLSTVCEERNMEFTFDVEQACDVKLTTTSFVLPTATPTATSDSTKSSTPETTTKGTTPDGTTEASAPDGAAEAQSSNTTEASSTGSVTPLPNSAPQGTVIFNCAAILVAASAMLLL
ncbi:hypothetical protein V502_04478 [Pseudogymnoascus sp. VKM F-4520 (FW-2644)]|nr:hypothetical protein V502_04478 [Pseudogymnoascus sp. VKM F-4520 (FW-2644)]